MTASIKEQTLVDRKEDYALLAFLAQSYLSNIQKAKRDIKYLKKNFPSQSSRETIERLSNIEQNLELFLKHLTVSDTYTDYLSSFDYVRSLVSSIAGAISSLESQSPSFFSSWYSQAGRFTGRIQQSINDYYRDQHAEGNMYEKQFKKEYIDCMFAHPVRVFATNSGMAALTTIVGFIQGEEKTERPIFLGKSCYFEEKFVVRTFFPNRVIEIDEQNIPEIMQLTKKLNPAAIFLDSLSNSATMIQPDLPSILKEVEQVLKNNCYIVIDNTPLSITYQPLRRRLFSDKTMRLIIWESLLKHHQYGLDRVNGGIIYTNAPNGEHLYTYRDHLGTNISDTHALSLPAPNRKFLQQRLQRHKRNNTILLKHLPGILASPSAHLPFHGAFLKLCFPPHRDNISEYKKFLQKAFHLAKKRNVPLIGGTSFGFPVTRLYIPASRPGQGTPFVRISVGTEPLSDILKVAQLLADVV
jgi:cystathionine beta-lyase/cystathionine gamma-synthase